MDHRVDTVKWLEQIPLSTHEELAEYGITCPHAKELDKALTQYISKSLTGIMKTKLDDKLRELQREPDISKRWMTGRQKLLWIINHQTQGDKQKRHMYHRDKLRMHKLINDDLRSYLKRFDEICFYQEEPLPENEKKEYFWREIQNSNQLYETIKFIKLQESQNDQVYGYAKLRDIVERHLEDKHLKKLDRQMTVPGMPTMSSAASSQQDRNLDCKAWKRTGYCPNFTRWKQTCPNAHRKEARGSEKGKARGKGKGKEKKGGKGKGKKGYKGKKGDKRYSSKGKGKKGKGAKGYSHSWS